VVVEDGNFIVIAGMIQDQTNESQYKVPVLGDIPWLGALFRYDTREHIKTQTMVFLRPTVIRNEAGERSVALDRYGYIRDELANNAPAHNLVLHDMNVEALGPMPEKGIEADAQRILVATAVNADQAQQIQRQLHDIGMDARRLNVEALPTADGSPSKQLRVIANVAPADIERTLALLRGLGFSPTLIGAASKSDASSSPGTGGGGANARGGGGMSSTTGAGGNGAASARSSADAAALGKSINNSAFPQQ
jgi:hypothetical protein